MQITAAAALVALALVPGYLFLWLTNEIRKPSSGSALGELLEVLTVGIVTTGPAVGIFALINTDRAQRTITTFQKIRTASNHDVRCAVLAVAILFLLAGIFAWMLAELARYLVAKQTARYAPNVFQGAFGEVPAGHIPVLRITTTDGNVVEGVLKSFSDSDHEDQRLIALERPLRLWIKGRAEPYELLGDRYIVTGPTIQNITVVHQPDPPSDPAPLEQADSPDTLPPT